MKTSTTPRTPRKTTTTQTAPKPRAKAKVSAAAPAEKAPRARRAAPKRTKAPNGVGAARTSAFTAEDVRFRAFEIFLSRNGSGDEVSDWLQAEQELAAQAS